VVGADLVIFDLDDTLFNHVGAARDAVAGWLLNRDVEPTEELISVWFDAESRNVAAWHQGELDWQGQRRARVMEMLDAIGNPVSDADSLDRLFDEYLAHYEAGWSAFPDVEPMLEALEREPIRIAVLTNGADYQQRQKLVAIGLEQRVGPVYCSDVIGFAKPDVRAFQHVCEHLGTDPSAAVSVGDRYDLDVLAARDAGLSAVHLDRNVTGTGDERYRIHTLSDLPRLLANR
jgi:putative hydrolase of the HAD superfamily